MQKTLKPNDKNCYNFVSPYGLGDTLMLCAFKDAWEKQNNSEIHFIIKPAHEVVMKMYGITNYSFFDHKQAWPEMLSMKERMDNTWPEKGKVFIAHPYFHTRCAELLQKYDDSKNIKPFENFYREFLELPMDAEMHMPKKTFDVSGDVREKLRGIANPKDVILLLPEAQTLPALDVDFWKYVARKLKNKGRVIQYAFDPEKRIPGVKFVDFSIEEIIQLATECKSVFAYRSGMCDLMASFANNLIVLYPESFKETKTRYSLSRIFKKNIPEFICSHNSKCKMTLFGFIPLFTVVNTTRLNKTLDRFKKHTWIKSFGVPVLCVKKHKDYTKYRLFNLITLLKVYK